VHERGRGFGHQVHDEEVRTTDAQGLSEPRSSGYPVVRSASKKYRYQVRNSEKGPMGRKNAARGEIAGRWK